MTCDICGGPGFGTANGMTFCTEHQGDAFRLQLSIVAMEKGAPIELVERAAIAMLEDLIARDGR